MFTRMVNESRVKFVEDLLEKFQMAAQFLIAQLRIFLIKFPLNSQELYIIFFQKHCSNGINQIKSEVFFFQNRAAAMKIEDQ